ncbi:hypothetical protein [Asticcacaulis benevestitus]|uniref:Uncharacterized protein n=1 Tax=Asticcacaulis benevestitus DSM 16100 = ATCC BAA-896 TaxID=1121022 RepID=V4PZH6_9CAUL|nr:hypothetical protein [Asticcacaulis benevestitus]ESQ92829.1 hypothetical protein ABENE_06925 [Asticcacaulis benevestitus DSM 16100 = ATCC BAA-896]
MSRRAAKELAGLSGSADLTLFPVDQNAIQRLAHIVTPDQLQQNRLTTIATIMALLEPVLKDIDRMEELAGTLHPTPPDLIKAIAEARETVEHFYVLLGDSFRWA